MRWPWLVGFVAHGGCSLIDGLGVSGDKSIEYPTLGSFGVNVLDLSLETTTGEFQSLHARLGDDASLRIRVELVGGSELWTIGFNFPSEVKWDIFDDFANNAQEFRSPAGEPRPDVRFAPKANTMIRVSYFENGESTASTVKVVNIIPPP